MNVRGGSGGRGRLFYTGLGCSPVNYCAFQTHDDGYFSFESNGHYFLECYLEEIRRVASSDSVTSSEDHLTEPTRNTKGYLLFEFVHWVLKIHSNEIAYLIIHIADIFTVKIKQALLFYSCSSMLTISKIVWKMWGWTMMTFFSLFAENTGRKPQHEFPSQ